MRIFRLVFVSLLTSFVIAISLVSTFYYYFNRSMDNPALVIKVPIGQSMTGFTKQLQDNGLLVQPWLWRLLYQLTAVSIKAGSYAIEQNTTQWAIYQAITTGRSLLYSITIPEGVNFSQFRQILNSANDLNFVTLQWSDEDFIKQLQINASSPEGWFFPDTYYYAPHSQDLVIYQQAHKLMADRLQRLWHERAQNLPLDSPYQALILASIVEKETNFEQDRKLIASVFINRLKLGMLLQSDPTVIYGLQKTFDGNLKRSHLEADAPYNTYTRLGLPPTPIALPGLASLTAALQPASSDYLFFVARGDGSSQFSRTLREHNRAVNRYQR